MTDTLAVLIVEDSESDAQMITRVLKKAGYHLIFDRVESTEDMKASLNRQAWDIVISDYSLPQFNGHAALKLLKETEQDIPFIIVSDVVGEETAVAMMKAGAHDYLRKSDLARLVPAVARELEQAQDRRERKLAESALRENKERFELTIEAAGVGTWDWNIQTGENILNERWAEIVGYTLKELMPISIQAWFDLTHPDDLKKSTRLLEEHFKGETENYKTESRMKHKNGQWIWVLDRGKVLTRDANGKPLRMLGTHTDITELKQAEDKLHQLARAVEHSPVSIAITAVNGNIEYINPKFTAVTGYTLEEAQGKTLRILKSGKMPPEVYTELWQTILSGSEWNGELLNCKKNGELYWENSSISSIIDSKGNITHFIAVNEDITARKEAEEKIRLLNAELEQLAVTDYLTNLYNRRYFMKRGNEELKRAKRSKQPLSILMLDIDEFKNINDTYGHETGDFALKQVVATLKYNLRDIDILGRMGGDEFTVLLPNTKIQDAAKLAERVRQDMEQMNFQTPEASFTIAVTISIGVAAFTDRTSNVDDMLRNADTALYQAKRAGRNRVVKYENDSTKDSDAHPALNRN